MITKYKRTILIATGSICVAIGIIGIFVPILPTTPFLLIAAACYLRSSQRFYLWLTNNRILGACIKSYLEGKGMPLKIKIFTISILWVVIGLSIFFTPILAIKIILAIVAIGVSVHIILREVPKKLKNRVIEFPQYILTANIARSNIQENNKIFATG